MVHTPKPTHLVTSTATATSTAMSTVPTAVASSCIIPSQVNSLILRHNFWWHLRLSYDPLKYSWCRACTMELQDFWHLSSLHTRFVRDLIHLLRIRLKSCWSCSLCVCLSSLDGFAVQLAHFRSWNTASGLSRMSSYWFQYELVPSDA